ncbi:DUF7127 family protein [Halorubrum sp. DTA98]|uniref:DUF7127 family protein n=1 Tax=Halorubrum sp. DTA98 TaxID=3402163 RepID=UPI003AAB320A
MTLTQSTGGDALFRRYDYEDKWVVAADVGVDDETITVDTVGDTAIIVIEDGDEPVESEFTLPGTADSVSVINGVLTVEGAL